MTMGRGVLLHDLARRLKGHPSRHLESMRIKSGSSISARTTADRRDCVPMTWAASSNIARSPNSV